MRSRLVADLKRLDAMAVENPAKPGTPDINYCEGWIECKYLKHWPVIPDTNPVLFPHFTPQQRQWMKSRCDRGGNVYLMAKIGRDWLLFEGEWAWQHFGRAPRPSLLANAIRVWENGLKPKELIACLRRSVS